MSGSRDAGRPEGDRRRAGGWQDAGTGWAGGQAGAVRGLSWDTILAAVDLTTCLFPANPQSTVIDSFHAALQIARALCSVPPHIAVPEHAVLDLWTVGRSALGVTREQRAALCCATRIGTLIVATVIRVPWRRTVWTPR